jgi:hypothetical protein
MFGFDELMNIFKEERIIGLRSWALSHNFKESDLIYCELYKKSVPKKLCKNCYQKVC